MIPEYVSSRQTSFKLVDLTFPREAKLGVYSILDRPVLCFPKLGVEGVLHFVDGGGNWPEGFMERIIGAWLNFVSCFCNGLLHCSIMYISILSTSELYRRRLMDNSTSIRLSKCLFISVFTEMNI